MRNAIASENSWVEKLERVERRKAARRRSAKDAFRNTIRRVGEDMQRIGENCYMRNVHREL